MNADEQQEVQKLLSEGAWYGGLPTALQQLILSLSVVRIFAKGQIISLEETLPKGLFAVIEGRVHLVREIGPGDEALVHVAEPGFWFGELAVLNGTATALTALAHTAVRTLLLSRAHFDRIVAEEPRYYREFARLALERHASLIRAVAEARGLAPEARLRGRLASLARLQRQDRASAAPAALAVSQADLARMVGVSRQTLNAMLGKLQREGLIEVGFRRIRVLDSVRLVDPYVASSAGSSAGATARGGPPIGTREAARRRGER